MQLKQQTNCAVRVLAYLGEEKKRQATTKEIAAAIGVLDNYLPKLLRTLRDAGWVHSATGVTGGYMLCADPRDITLWDVMNLTEDTVLIDRSLEETNAPNTVPDPARARYARLQEMIQSYATGVTIRDIIERNTGADS